jgi:hypothetical protein
MPADPKPLFRPEAVQPLLEAFEPPPTALAARAKLNRWATLLKTPQAAGMRETELRDEFIYDVFRDLLGYDSSVQDSASYTLKKEAFIETDGTYADARFGWYRVSDYANTPHPSFRCSNWPARRRCSNAACPTS